MTAVDLSKLTKSQLRKRCELMQRAAMAAHTERNQVVGMLAALVKRTGRERITVRELEAATKPDVGLSWEVKDGVLLLEIAVQPSQGAAAVSGATQ